MVGGQCRTAGEGRAVGGVDASPRAAVLVLRCNLVGEPHRPVRPAAAQCVHRRNKDKRHKKAVLGVEGFHHLMRVTPVLCATSSTLTAGAGASGSDSTLDLKALWVLLHALSLIIGHGTAGTGS